MFKLKLITRIFFQLPCSMARHPETLNIDAAHTYMLAEYISLLSHIISASHWTPSESHNVYWFSKAPPWKSWAPSTESVSGPLKWCFCNDDSLAMFSKILFFFIGTYWFHSLLSWHLVSLSFFYVLMVLKQGTELLLMKKPTLFEMMATSLTTCNRH